MSPRLGATIFYAGRILQVFAMWILLLDVFVLAGPNGPPPNPFYLGIGMFFLGWFMVKQTSKR